MIKKVLGFGCIQKKDGWIISIFKAPGDRFLTMKIRLIDGGLKGANSA